MKKLIFINRYFYPDHSATSQLLSDLAFQLANGKMLVHIVTSRQRYDDPTAKLVSEENIYNVHVHRIWTSRFGRDSIPGRAFDYLTFYISATFFLFFLVKKNDTVIAKTDPPLISVFAAVATRVKGARLINWLQDLFPEIASALGVNGVQKGFLFDFIKWLRNWSLKVAAKNIVLGELMKARLINEGMKPDRIDVIHNWADCELIHPVDRVSNRLRADWGVTNKFVIGYSGNLGRAHEFDTILDAAEILKDKHDIVFLFIGGGTQVETVRREAAKRGLSNVIFKPYQLRGILSESLSVPDVHLISLRPELESLIVPSKFYGIAGVGRTVIFIGDKKGEIPSILAKENCGFTINVGEKIILAELITNLAAKPELVRQGDAHARAVFEQKFNSKYSIEQWKVLLSDIF